ncbi:M55 family metallopeptidase [Phaeacidiphilus oryzae]|uniref:M55 family metallopeptidase n=1 Tax=Phaeacidiphilus oryzae TaxID=348818 RepID=UPI000560234B|nr:M55 family metallopeptidase [Phaeacidiphilus oryzae]
MRVYISADMEGVTGLVDSQDVQLGGGEYEYGRAMMTEDVNAAVRGALAAGAEYVLVNDSHMTMRNLLPDRIHPEAVLQRGKPKRHGMVEGLDGSYDAMLCIGYHARAGRLGVLSHSYMGHEIEDMWLDGRPTGEFGFAHAVAAAHGVPVVAVSGDDAACAEAAEWEPRISRAVVKHAKDRFAARLVPPAEARKAIEEACAEGVRAAAGGARPADQAVGADGRAVELAVRWQNASVASQLTAVPGVSLRDDRTVVVHGTAPDLFALFGVFMRVASNLTNQHPYC